MEYNSYVCGTQLLSSSMAKFPQKNNSLHHFSQTDVKLPRSFGRTPAMQIHPSRPGPSRGFVSLWRSLIKAKPCG